MSQRVVDARGRACPQPIIDLALATRGLPVGTQVHLLADDPAARADVPAWCRMKGHRLVTVEEAATWVDYLVELG